MFEQLYTTKMSANKRVLQGRFAKMRQKSGRLSKWMAVVMSVALLLTVSLATIVLANVDSDGTESGITFTANGEQIRFSNPPFIAENTIYLPLRELFTKLGITDLENAEIEWDNGKIYLTVPNHDGGLVHYGLVIGDAHLGISHNAPLNAENVLKMALGMDAPPMLVGSTTYLPYEYFDYMLDRNQEERGRYQLTCTVDGNNEGFGVLNTFRSEKTPDEWGLTLSAKEVTPRGATLVFRQNGDKTEGKLQYGDTYGLEVLSEGQWVALPRLPGMEDAAFHMIAYLLEGQGGFETGVNWYPLYGDLDPGVYRISKDVDLFRAPGDYDTKTYYAEFVVTDSQVYHTPDLVWPVASDTISQAFGSKVNPATGAEIVHNGIDLVAPKGTPVLSATDGTVAETGFNSEKGNYVIIENVNRIRTLYAHLDTVAVAKGDDVIRGGNIGTVGNTGMSTGAHLHFEISIDGQYYNPELVY